MKVTHFLVMFGLSLIITYVIVVHKFEYKTVLQQKYIEEPEYRLYRHKQSDIVLTLEEYQSLKTSNSDAVYISERLYFFVIDGERLCVNKNIYDKYIEGSKVRYLETIMSLQKEIQ